MEFMIKHPIITLLIVNEICSTIRSAVSRRYARSIADDTFNVISDELGQCADIIKEANESKAKIGFRVA